MDKKQPLDLFGPPLTILILSPQPWDGLQVSKHHYARELAALGHRIFFVNPPGGAPAIAMRASDISGITLVDHPPLPFSRLKFRFRAPFEWAADRRARAIVAATGPIDLLWDFDNAGQFSDHRAFGASWSVLHIVDRVRTGERRHRHANLLLAVDASLLADIDDGGQPRFVVGHGLSPLFAEAARKRLAAPRRRDRERPVVVGFIGNLAQHALDRPRTMALVLTHRDVIFRFIGPVQGGMSAELLMMQAWAEQFGALPNVELPGLLTGDALIAATADVDIWLLPYDQANDRNRGVNSHKLLEYFALGGEVVSSAIAAQADAPGIFMAPPDAPDQIGARLDAAIAAVRGEVDTGWRARTERALESSYRTNVATIAAHIASASACAVPKAR